MSALAILNAHTRATFVRPTVKEIPITTKIIDAIFPYYPKNCTCIAGFLDNGDQYWKVNYHWDLLTHKIDEMLAKPAIDAKHKGFAKAIKSMLMTNAPVPQTGYRNDKAVGVTKDLSAPERIVARHKLLTQSKRDFEVVMVKAGLVNAQTKRNPPLNEKAWWLAVAPLAPPGDSKHGKGYALDIAGNNAEIIRISKALGATLAFNEASHVHCEWQGSLPQLASR